MANRNTGERGMSKNLHRILFIYSIIFLVKIHFSVEIVTKTIYGIFYVLGYYMNIKKMCGGFTTSKIWVRKNISHVTF